MDGIVTPMVRAIVAKYGAIRSGVRMYQANFLPASMPTCTALSSVLATRAGGGECWAAGGQGPAIYAANAGFDVQHTGQITLDGLAHFVAKSAAVAYVQQVIASAYAAAPGGVGSMTDPVYGLDFGGSSTTKRVLLVVGIVGAAAALAYAARQARVRRYLHLPA
jgi:hypothetical protein